MAPAGAIAHSRPLLSPCASFLSFFSSVAPLRPLGLGFLGRGLRRSTTLFTTTLRTQVRPAIEYVSGEEGLRPRLRRYVTGTRLLQVRLLGHPKLRKRPWPLRRSRGDGNGGRFVRSRCFLLWCSMHFYTVFQMLSLWHLVPFWSLYSDGPLSSRPQPLGRGGGVAPCEDTREDLGLSL